MMTFTVGKRPPFPILLDVTFFEFIGYSFVFGVAYGACGIDKLSASLHKALGTNQNFVLELWELMQDLLLCNSPSMSRPSPQDTQG